MRRLTCLLMLICGGLFAACTHLPAGEARELTVMTSGGFARAFADLAPEFERSSGIRIAIVHGSSQGGATDSIPERLKRGEPADVVILAEDGLTALTAQRFILNESRTDLGRSTIGMAVKAGQPVPDISTVEKFVQVLRAAPSIGYSASASGTYLATELWPRLGLADEILPKAKRILSERVGTVVARGEVAIGFQQLSELLPIAGITVVGPIPREYQKVTIFSAAITANSRATGDARRLLRFLASPAASEQIERSGLEPLSSRP